MPHPMFNRRVIFFGGKGGVGKTTMAASTAVWAAKRLGKKTLVVSTDPAHSLADSLGRTLYGDEITPIEEIPGLHGIEIDAEAALSEYGTILQSQMGGESEILAEFIGEDPSELSMPGSDEAVSFLKMLEFIDTTDFDLIVYDTAPTGHTLKLLSLPELLDSWLYKMIKMRHRIGRTLNMLRLFSRGGNDQDLEEQAFSQLEMMRDQVIRARTILTDPTQAEFIVVTIPTLMALWETERLITALRSHEMSVKQIYVNQITPENPTCVYCARRYENQKKTLDRLLKLYADEFEIVQIPLLDHEIQGLEALLTLGDELYSSEDD